MKSLFLLCLTLLLTMPIHGQNYDDRVPVPDQVMALGRGTASALDWHPDGEVLAVGARTGVWLYDESLDDLIHFDALDWIINLSWSSTGDMLATLDNEGILNIWAVTFDPYTFNLQQTWSFGNTGENFISNLVWSSDQFRLAVVNATGARVLDVRTGQEVLHIPDVKYNVTWHPDGTQLAGAVDLVDNMGEQIRVWDAVTGDSVTDYISPEPYLYWSDIQWSPDGSVLVGLTSVPGTLHAWDMETSELLSDVDTFSGEFSALFEMWWSDDGQQLFAMSRYVSGRAVTRLIAWDTSDWTTMDRPGNFDSIWKIDKRPRSNMLTFLTSDSQIVMWDMDESNIVHVRSDHAQPPKMLAWSPDSQYLAGANSHSEIIQVWNMSDVPQMQSITRTDQWLDMEAMRWNMDSTAIRTVLENFGFTAPGTQLTGYVVELHVQNDESQRLHETGGHIPHPHDDSDSYLPFSNWSDDFMRMATVLDHEPITLWTVGTSENGALYIDENISTIANDTYDPQVFWSPDNTMLAVIKRNEVDETSAWVYDADTGALIHRLRPSFPATVYDISWSPDSTMVALFGRRGIAGSGETEYRLDIKVIDSSTKEAEHILSILDINATFSHAWHPNSQVIAVNLSTGIHLYPIESVPMGIRPAKIASTSDMQVSTLAWSPGGEWLAGSHADGTIRIWDVAVGDDYLVGEFTVYPAD